MANKWQVKKNYSSENLKRKLVFKLGFGLSLLAILVLIFVYVLVIHIQNPITIMAVLVPLVVFFFVCAIILSMRLFKKMERNSFHEGMHLIIDSSPTPTFMVRDSMKILYCNEETPKLYGLTNKQEYFEKFFQLMPGYQPNGKRSLDMLSEIMKKVFKDGVVTFEWTQSTLDGEELPLQITFVRANFDRENHAIGFVKDLREIHEIKKKEEAAKKRMQIILDASPMVCVLFDENSIPIEVNSEVEHMFNLSDKQIFLDNIERFFPAFQPDGSPSMEKAAEVAKLAIRQGSYRHEWTYQYLDGTPVLVEEILQKVVIDGKEFLITYLRDLREYQKSKEIEHIAQQRLQTIMDWLSEHLEAQSSAITESAGAIEEMVANIRSVNNTLSKNAQNVKALEESSAVGHAGLKEVDTNIKEIANESESLLEINSVMQNIASQTNLLSMNAAIEAAHAGESGRGFAVVADEIRQLAENSSKQSKIISTVLKKIKGSIDKITRSTDNVINKFEAIDSGVKIVAEQETDILGAMSEQSVGSTQIMQAMAQVNEITGQVKADVRQMIEAAAKISA
ncbi:MAG: methyl-accepting chemotaxis protein [Treponema sp.]|nr:methyl-accepting chemotaxis protein [Treponema sp.]